MLGVLLLELLQLLLELLILLMRAGRGAAARGTGPPSGRVQLVRKTYRSCAFVVYQRLHAFKSLLKQSQVISLRQGKSLLHSG